MHSVEVFSYFKVDFTNLNLSPQVKPADCVSNHREMAFEQPLTQSHFPFDNVDELEYSYLFNQTFKPSN
jgi:hypothetical protein